MAYLYGELKEGGGTDLEAHLHVCPDCKRSVAGWRGAMSTLNAWKVPTHRSRAWLESPALRWAAAAVVLIGAGFASGRYSAPGTDMKALQASLLPELRKQVQQDLLAALDVNGADPTTPEQWALRASAERFAAGTVAAATSGTQRMMADFYDAYQSDRAKDKQDTRRLFNNVNANLEKVAVVGESRLKNAENLLGELVANSNAQEGANPLPAGATSTHD